MTKFKRHLIFLGIIIMGRKLKGLLEEEREDHKKEDINTEKYKPFSPSSEKGRGF